MLSELYIKNLAVIHEMRLEFGRGFHVLTGETGAGKSILIEAIGLILGSKIKNHLIREGEQETLVEATFNVKGLPVVQDFLKNEDLTNLEDADELIIKRHLRKDGKSRVFINHQRSSLSNLQKIAPFLIDVTGQHDQLQLLKSGQSRFLLDAFLENKKAFKDYQAEYKICSTLFEDLSHKEKMSLEKEERLQWIDFQLKELKGLSVKSEDELAELLELRQTLKHKDVIESFSRKIDNFQEVALTGLNALEALWSKHAVLQNHHANFSEKFEDLKQNIEDFAFDLIKASNKNLPNISSYHLSEVEAKLYKVDKLKRKFGPNFKDLLQKKEDLETEKLNLEALDVDIANLKSKLQKRLVVLKDKAQILFNQRQKAAHHVSDRVQKELKDLNMNQAQFEVRVQLVEALDDFKNYHSLGADDVSFWLSANPGLGFQPLMNVASGGETSRLFLAIKNVLSTSFEAKTFIFDEIDTGISGAAVELTGKKLKTLAKTSQVFCVTHHAQIASLADQHYFVSKNIQKGKTFTRIRTLTSDEQINEVARLMGGIKISQKNLDYAKEMINHS